MSPERTKPEALRFERKIYLPGTGMFGYGLIAKEFRGFAYTITVGGRLLKNASSRIYVGNTLIIRLFCVPGDTTPHGGLDFCDFNTNPSDADRLVLPRLLKIYGYNINGRNVYSDPPEATAKEDRKIVNELTNNNKATTESGITIDVSQKSITSLTINLTKESSKKKIFEDLQVWQAYIEAGYNGPISFKIIVPRNDQNADTIIKLEEKINQINKRCNAIVLREEKIDSGSLFTAETEEFGSIIRLLKN